MNAGTQIAYFSPILNHDKKLQAVNHTKGPKPTTLSLPLPRKRDIQATGFCEMHKIQWSAGNSMASSETKRKVRQDFFCIRVKA